MTGADHILLHFQSSGVSMQGCAWHIDCVSLPLIKVVHMQLQALLMFNQFTVSFVILHIITVGWKNVVLLEDKADAPMQKLSHHPSQSACSSDSLHSTS